MNYLNPSQTSAVNLLQYAENKVAKDTNFIMLNLLRLKDVADYSQTSLSRADHVLDSEQAFNRYVKETLPYLHESGGELLLLADAANYFIGPDAERWDKVMLIKQNSVSDFFAFAQNQDYLKVLAHRQASIEDSRLLPLWSDDRYRKSYA